ncbi:MAG: protein kinase [Rhodobacteraceae bacterium]|nr:protein kinase [Paracoccaceae bacterium]
MTNSPIEVEPGTQIIGTYEILEHINTGGMGEVYRGVNIHNDEIVAIKVVLPALAHDRKILALFQKESTVLRRLAHEAIVRYEVFTIDPGISRPCLVMEYVDGQPLTDIIDAGPMPVDGVLRLLRRVASGLDTAHRAGVVHRDLSPDNVILPDGNVEHAKIIDFGIAKAATPGGGTLIGGQFAGKYAYVAPEQFGWYDGVVTGQADVYSLGLLAAALARGAPLEMGSNLAEAVRSRTSVPDLDGVPEELRPLLSRMLEPDPANRAESMAEVLATVQQMLDPQASVPPGAGTSVPPAGSVPPGTAAGQSLPPGGPSSRPPGAGGDATVLADRPVGMGPGPVVPGSVAPGQSGSAAPGQVQTTPPDAGDSPFGSAAPSHPPGPLPGDRAEKPRKRSAIPALLLSVVLVGGALAGGAWYAGLLPFDDSSEPVAEVPVTDSAEQVAWIAATDPVEDCAYVQVASVDAAANTITLQGFGRRAVAFNPLLAEFAETHGYRPSLSYVPLREGQCSLLGFLNDLRDTGPRIALGALSVRVDQETLDEGDTLSGAAGGATGEVTSLLMFEHSGAMQNLSHRVLRDGADTVRFTQPDLLFHEPAQPNPDIADSVLLLVLNSDRALDTINLIGRDVALPASELPNFWRFLLSDVGRGDEPISITLTSVPVSTD